MTKNGERTLGYNSIVKYGVYTNTDVIYTQNSKGYRHYIVARSGAPTASFEMQYTGQTSLTVDALGNLKIATSLGTLKQPKAKAYTMNNTTGVLTLLGWQPAYVITGGNKVSFTYGTWPAGSTLVIEIEKTNQQLNDYEPVANLGWSTYVGGNSYDSYNATTTDANGYQYAAGDTWSSQFPNFGGGQATNLAVTSAIWSKFSEVHEMKYSTIYGSAFLESAQTLAYDIDVTAPTNTPNHAVFLVGSTNAPNLIIQTVVGADNDLSLGGFGDGFIARFDTDGLLTWSRYYDGENLISIDHDNDFNIYFTGYVNSSTGFPLVDIGGDGYYESTLPGNGDLFIGKINSSLNLTWSTFYGGSAGFEEIGDLVCDREQNAVYITGSTTSNNLPLGTTYYDNTLGGYSDAFITKFSTNGVLLWGTYIGGISSEGSPDISLDFNNKLYFTSTTTSSNLFTDYGTTTWADNTYAGVFDVFIFVFDAVNMLPVWASYFGESQPDSYPHICIDNNNGFYLTGITLSDNFTLQDNIGNYYQQNYVVSDCSYANEAFLVHYNSAYQRDWLT